jgi:hypothetical protein
MSRADEVTAILGRWRRLEWELADAKRQVADVLPDSRDARTLTAQIERFISEWGALRDTYERLVDEASNAGDPAPEAWPDAESRLT